MISEFTCLQTLLCHLIVGSQPYHMGVLTRYDPQILAITGLASSQRNGKSPVLGQENGYPLPRQVQITLAMTCLSCGRICDWYTEVKILRTLCDLLLKIREVF